MLNKQVTRPGVIDIEASGFGPQSYPIEIGVVKSNGERFCSLIKPKPLWKHWCSQAEQVHGISFDLICRKGKPVRQLCAELNEFVGDETLYSDSWGHDSGWLNKLYYEAKIICSFRMLAIEYIVSEAQLNEWDETKEEVQMHMGLCRHRASCDALVIQQTFVESWQKSLLI